jgi:hypothetical protein
MAYICFTQPEIQPHILADLVFANTIAQRRKK